MSHEAPEKPVVTGFSLSEIKFKNPLFIQATIIVGTLVMSPGPPIHSPHLEL